ncbi:MAG TPA: hypothetical protein VK966_05480, partial [Longimicrobiales bacterium]|nr:hypothetical protein [Longimicrobiales bacterium]
DDPADPDPDPEAELAGSYDVQTFRYDADDSDQSLDLALIPAAQGGPWGILEMTVETDGAFDGTMKLPTPAGVQEFDVGGDIEVTGPGTVRIDFDTATDALGVLDDFEDGTYAISGDVLTLVLPDVTFDFTQSGDEVDADLTIVASRQ